MAFAWGNHSWFCFQTAGDCTAAPVRTLDKEFLIWLLCCHTSNIWRSMNTRAYHPRPQAKPLSIQLLFMLFLELFIIESTSWYCPTPLSHFCLLR